jgi:hypothetical protein
MLNVRDIPWRAAAVVLALALLASIVTGREQSPVAQAPRPAPVPTAESQQAPQSDLALDKLVRLRTEHDVLDLFAIQSWAPAAVQPAAAPLEPAPPEPPAPAIPIAPPLPFAYLGRMVKNDRTLVYLLKGEDMLLAEIGRTLGDYRIDGIGESTMTFVYVPSGTRQTLAFPARE